ncbi:Uncharacterised protein [uncultured archaeon]|nr:Uncharacterised protein [uncultured archaeon]
MIVDIVGFLEYAPLWIIYLCSLVRGQLSLYQGEDIYPSHVTFAINSRSPWYCSNELILHNQKRVV